MWERCYGRSLATISFSARDSSQSRREGMPTNKPSKISHKPHKTPKKVSSRTRYSGTPEEKSEKLVIKNGAPINAPPTQIPSTVAA